MLFANGYKGKENRTGVSSKEYLDGHSYGGLTRIGSALREKVPVNLRIPSRANPCWC